MSYTYYDSNQYDEIINKLETQIQFNEEKYIFLLTMTRYFCLMYLGFTLFNILLTYIIKKSIKDDLVNNYLIHHRRFLTTPFNNDSVIITDLFENYIEMANIRRFIENKENLDKVVDFYKHSTEYLTKATDIIEDKYRFVFVNKNKFMDYYKDHFINEEDLTLVSNDQLVSVNLYNLYQEKLSDSNGILFNIHDERKYFPVRKGDVCFFTNLSKLNTIKWLIEIGFYDYLKKNE